MSRHIILAVILTLALFLVTSTAPTLLNIPSSAAHAQGAFGKKSTGTTDEQRKADELKRQKEAEARKAEEAKKEKVKQEKAQSDTAKKSTGKSSSEAKETKKAGERDTKSNSDPESRVVTSSDTDNKQKTDSDNRKTPDARPDKERTTNKDVDNKKNDKDNSAYKRVDERPEIETGKKSNHGYPYDPDWISWRRKQDSEDMDPFPSPSKEIDDYAIHQVVNGICYAWLHNEPAFISYLLQKKRMIKIYRDGIRLPDMRSADFYEATVDAMNQWKTKEYDLDIEKYNWNKIIARGHHRYRDYDSYSVIHQSDVYYVLHRIKDHWIIVEVGFSSIMDTEEIEREPIDR